MSYQIIGSDNDLEHLRKKSKYAIIAIGQIPDSGRRRAIEGS